MTTNKKDFIFQYFGKSSEYYFEIINIIEKDIITDSCTYGFIDEKIFSSILSADVSKGMKIYWFEILQRVYIASIIGLFRQNSWIKGIINAIDNNNYMQFASTFRGFIESSSDINDSLFHVPLNLSELSYNINKALKGNLNELFLSTELETNLIHFTHARKPKKKEQLPDYMEAKTARSYLSSYNNCEHQKLLHDCYSELCEITHPASLSVFSYMDEDSYMLKFNINKDKENIDKFFSKYKPIFEYIFELSINLLIINLKTLNLFKLESFYTPSIESINLDKIPIVNKILNNFKEN